MRYTNLRVHGNFPFTPIPLLLHAATTKFNFKDDIVNVNCKLETTTFARFNCRLDQYQRKYYGN